MSLPDGFIEDLRTRLSLAQVVGRKVIWEAKKTNAGKGDYWAPCPFHTEKTASFHVDDRKGFYYCFGCHAKGDAINFVRETENVGFMDAIKILAAEAGMPIPESDPRAAARAEKRTELVDVMQAAVQHYLMQLKTAPAQGARDYLKKRGLTDITQTTFEIGFAPDTRTGLFDALIAKGFNQDQIIEAGLCALPDRGGKPYDRFRDRIMFPIRDQRGRAIAFGGRAMAADARAKYLNSPETPLFDKGRNLYNLGPAREAAGKVNGLIVAEGYMDVIALHQAGFKHSVAPLGTAITENQLQLMWRVNPEPTITLDGDVAGMRAALRLIDIVLPLLEPGKSLRFAMLPEGLDPDDLINTSGAQAMQTVLGNAKPMVSLLWRRETEDKVFDSPERRAALDKNLKAALAKIKDPSIYAHYNDAIRQLRKTLFSPKRDQKKWTPFNKRGPMPAVAGTKSSLLARQSTGPEAEARVRESAILLGCLNHPQIAERFEEDLDRLHFICPDLREICHSLLSHLDQTLSLAQETQRQALRELVHTSIGYDAHDKLTSIGQVRDNPCLHPLADAELAAQAVATDIARQQAILGVMEEIREAETENMGIADEGMTWRLNQAAEAKRQADTGGITDEDNTDGEGDLSRKLQALIDQKIWKKDKK